MSEQCNGCKNLAIQIAILETKLEEMQKTYSERFKWRDSLVVAIAVGASLVTHFWVK